MLTVARRHVFSLSAPTHPVNPIINVTVPVNRKQKSIFKMYILNCTLIFHHHES